MQALRELTQGDVATRAAAAGSSDPAEQGTLAVQTDPREERLDLGKKRKYDTSKRPRATPRAAYRRDIPSDDPCNTQCCSAQCNTLWDFAAITALREQARAAATTQDGFKANMSQYVRPAASFIEPCQMLGKRVCRKWLKMCFGIGSTMINNLRGTQSANGSSKLALVRTHVCCSVCRMPTATHAACAAARVLLLTIVPCFTPLSCSAMSYLQND